MTVEAKLKDVADEAGVSVASVSRVLNELTNVSPATREKVLAAVKKLHYIPHSGARSLAKKRTDTIGVILPDLHGEFFSEVIRGIDKAAASLGFQVLMSNSHGDALEAANSLRPMRGRVDGFLVMSPHISEPFLENNLGNSVPVVLMNSHIEGSQYPAFNVDNYGGARLMIRHLARLGHRTITFINGPKDNFEAIERLRGYLDELQELGLSNYSQLIEGDFSETAGRTAGSFLINTGKLPDAVFAANDMMAAGCMSIFREFDVSVPKEVAVVGFDDIPVARFVTPGLTTVRANITELGRKATSMLASIIKADSQKNADDLLQPETFSVELVIRSSCCL